MRVDRGKEIVERDIDVVSMEIVGGIVVPKICVPSKGKVRYLDTVTPVYRKGAVCLVICFTQVDRMSAVTYGQPIASRSSRKIGQNNHSYDYLNFKCLNIFRLINLTYPSPPFMFSS